MKQKRPDRRVERTQRALHQALMTEILGKKYESVTVQEILDRANVGRSTFYTHYRDKDELLVTGLGYVKSLLKSAQAAAALTPSKPYERVIGFSPALFEHVYEYRAVNRALLGSSAEAVVRRHIHSALEAVVSEEVQTLVKTRRYVNPISPELLTHFVVSTCVSVLSWWLNAKNPMPPKEINEAYRQLVLPCLAAIFD